MGAVAAELESGVFGDALVPGEEESGASGGGEFRSQSKWKAVHILRNHI